MAEGVMILAGGTGGHVFPALAVAQKLRGRGVEVFWMGTKRGLEAKVVPGAGINMDWLTVSGFRGKTMASKFMAPLMILRACIQALLILLRKRPAVVLGMGGFVSGPGGLMALIMRIPLVIHEQNRVPGTTNRLLARWANVVLEAFPGTFSKSINAIYSGNPLREDIVTENFQHNSASVNRILVLGGSQGARVLNQIVPEALAILDRNIEVLHQTGLSDLESTVAAYENLELSARVTAFIDDMANAYAWADLVVCRAGAMTISELTATATPSILVPFPHAIDDHQTRNAEFLEESGAAFLLPQLEFSVDNLAKKITKMTDHPGTLETMGKAARALARLDATDTVARICLEQTKN